MQELEESVSECTLHFLALLGGPSCERLDLCAAGMPVGAHGGACIPQGFGLTEAPSVYVHAMF